MILCPFYVNNVYICHTSRPLWDDTICHADVRESLVSWRIKSKDLKMRFRLATQNFTFLSCKCLLPRRVLFLRIFCYAHHGYKKHNGASRIRAGEEEGKVDLCLLTQNVVILNLIIRIVAKDLGTYL